MLDQLLADWEINNTSAWQAVLNESGRNGIHEFMTIVNMWVNEKEFDPQWDASIRDWGRTAPKVAAAVRRVDDVRIDVLKQVFLGMGYDDAHAFIRARVTYVHQVGYYTLGVVESHRQRLKLLPLYVEILMREHSATSWRRRALA